MKKFYNKIKAERGITTLALVITVLVLLILSVIVIVTVSDGHGIFSKSSETVETYRINQLEESIHIAWNYTKIQGYSERMSLNDMTDLLKTELKQTDSSATTELKGEYIEVNYKGYRTIINVNEYLKKTEEIVYKHEGKSEFNGDNFINTGVCIYSEENIHKNFEISFNIESIDDNNTAQNTILSSMDESGSPWPGHNVKMVLSGGEIRAKIESNSNLNSIGDIIIPKDTKNIKILRLDDKLYYSFDDKKCLKINDFTGTASFNTPLTFGAALNGKNQPFRYFKGVLSDMTIKFLDDDVTVDDYNLFKKPLKTLFERKGDVIFNGTSDYFNTGEGLFSEENVDKDFEISFKVKSVATDNVTQATLVNTKLEAGAYPGFVYRINDKSKSFEFTSKAGTGDGTIDKYESITSVKIYRINRKMYVCINEEIEKEVYSYEGFQSYFSVPLTIGASLDKDGKPFRYFKGTLADIVFKVEE